MEVRCRHPSALPPEPGLLADCAWPMFAGGNERIKSDEEVLIRVVLVEERGYGERIAVHRWGGG